ncbi:SMC-Scp complex subunit ScpB [Scopulibacillus cellulosilyticus]|uniref:Segregation and condensation protein B n=1 Tax=Scopulibacillus cellulosilyticus TaxID=2665665 RepID=A0ABW2PUY0_9BACL
MQLNEMKAIIEGLLYITGDEGLSMEQLKAVLGQEETVIKNVINDMKNELDQEDRGLIIKEISGGYQLMTKPFLSKYIESFVEAPKPATLSQAALETLAIIAYKQPISRAEIEEIRGVKSEKALNTLTTRNLVKEIGRADGTGRAILYGVTEDFLSHFGLQSLNELPPIEEGKWEETQGDQESDLFYENFKQTIDDL